MTKTVRQAGISESQRLVKADRTVPSTHHFRAEVPSICQVLPLARVKG